MSEFKISRENANGIALLRVEGFLDAHTFEQLEETIRGIFESGCFKLVVDLGGVDYISSAGAGVLIGARSESQENGGDIVLLNPTEGVREVFDLLGLTQIFKIVNDRSAALAAF
ncbi:MAG TPA: STAS domain-containing protein [Planctomycetota bacterium]|nr:STAS domain-containing protein [Planctomycetota bacterium]